MLSLCWFLCWFLYCFLCLFLCLFLCQMYVDFMLISCEFYVNFLKGSKGKTCDDSFSAVWAATTSIKDAKCTELLPLRFGNTKPCAARLNQHFPEEKKKSAARPETARNRREPPIPTPTPLTLNRAAAALLLLKRTTNSYKPRFLKLKGSSTFSPVHGTIFKKFSSGHMSENGPWQVGLGFLQGKTLKKSRFSKRH